MSILTYTIYGHAQHLLHKFECSLIGFLQLADAIEDNHMAVRIQAEVHHTSAQAAYCSKI